MSPIATVVVPTFQRAEMLRQCLTSLEIARAGTPSGSVAVVVADDSLDSLSREMISHEFPGVAYVEGPRRGPASNRNCGAAQVSSAWLIFIDDDCIADPGWLVAYLSAFRQAGNQQLFEGRTRADRPRRTNAEESPINETGGYLWSCNMAISRRLFQEVQGFCESFPHPALEDVDLRLRLANAGHRAAFLVDASVCHPYRPMRGLSFFRKHTASYAHLLSLHPELRKSLSWYGVMLNTARMLFSTLKASLRYGTAGTGRMAYAVLAKAWVDARCLLIGRKGAPL